LHYTAHDVDRLRLADFYQLCHQIDQYHAAVKAAQKG